MNVAKVLLQFKFIKCYIDIDNNPIENDEDLTRRIKLIDELTNFNVIKNICLNCLENLIRKREEMNNQIFIEKENISSTLEELIREVESDEFSIFYFKLFQKKYLK